MYRVRGGRTGRKRLLTIGQFGTFTVEQARDRARALIVAVRDGLDPLVKRVSDRRAATVADLLSHYLTEYVEVHNAQSTRRNVRRMIESTIIPAIGRLRVADVTKADVRSFHSRLAYTPRTANLAIAILSKAFALSEEWNLRPEGSNPARGLKKFHENHRERFLTEPELQRLGDVLRMARDKGLPWRVKVKDKKSRHLARPENRVTPVNPVAIALIEFLLLSGARLGEALALRWSDVDVSEGTINLPSSKGAARRAHEVSRAVLELIKSQPRVDEHPFVFPSDPARVLNRPPKLDLSKSRPLQRSVVENAWQRIRHAAGLSDVRLHDLRHTVGTWASRSGANAFLVRDLLRHSGVAMTGRYVNRDKSPLRDLSNDVSDGINSALKNGKKPL